MSNAIQHRDRQQSLPVENSVSQEVAKVTARLSRYRLARDRARMRRLASSPQLASQIARLLSAHA